ncbi:MAG: hypothetical protein FWD75_08115 [Propionibacteriaceae bacterium]|nr:hypothetical protein [Propionibacteriaceae bacterium]
MQILVVAAVRAPEGDDLVLAVEQGFRDGGCAVDSLDMRAAVMGAQSGTVDSTVLRRGASAVTGKDLVVVVADEVSFADAGGPGLRQVSSWAEARAVPVIVVAGTCQISTRELRSVGVEAGYGVAAADDVRRIVQTWTGNGGSSAVRVGTVQ